MEHVVFFPGADGAEVYRRAADLEEAVRIVERLRNDNGVGDVSVFALNPVPLAFRTYVHVELPTETPAGEPESAAPEAVEVAQAEVEQAEVQQAEVEHAEVQQAEVEHAEPEYAPVEVAEVEQAEPEYAAVEVSEPELPEPDPEHAEIDQAGLQPAGNELAEPEHVEQAVEVPAEPALAAEPSIPPPPPLPPMTEFAEVEGEWTQPEPLADVEAFAPPAPPAPPAVQEPEPAFVPEPFFVDSVVEQPLEAIPVPVPVHEQSASELPPLTLAPGPLLLDGEPVAVAAVDHHEPEDQGGNLPSLVPADFNDLIPNDIVHGDLARPVDEPAEAPVAEAPVAEAPAQDAPYEAPVVEELPPLDVEVPADASSLEQLPPIPAAREVEQPVAARHEGPRGLGYFGG